MSDFGAMMVKDHSAANDKLKAIATFKGLDLPTSSGRERRGEHQVSPQIEAAKRPFRSLSLAAAVLSVAVQSLTIAAGREIDTALDDYATVVGRLRQSSKSRLCYALRINSVQT